MNECIQRLVLAALLALAATVAHAQSPGKALFDAYCAGCHGSEATGSGKAGTQLQRNPAALNTLSRAYGGRFPAELVRQVIDGRRVVQVHGPREMPVWGLVFLSDYQQPFGPPASETSAAQRIDQLIEYLKEIQE